MKSEHMKELRKKQAEEDREAVDLDVGGEY
jgi:hypothetical protein